MTRGCRIIGLTMGDPAGIGPEILVKAIAHPLAWDGQVPICVANPAVMRRAIDAVGRELELRVIRSIEEIRPERGTLNVYDLRLELDAREIGFGRVSPQAGHAAFAAVRMAIDLAMKGEIEAVVTAPLHKEALHQAGHRFAGHTEIFAHYTKCPRYTMMLVVGQLRIVHVSTHVPLRQACDAVTRERVLEVIELGHDACRRFGQPRPRIGVAGLNPHASDGGLFGDEEEQAIRPAIDDARKLGIEIEGPLPADTFFPKAIAGAYDLCVAMYHDQGHIPAKSTGFKYDASSRTWRTVNGVNVTLGLPIVRTSVDHGTAFDLAGTGTASEQSMLDAIACAARLCAGN